MYLLQFVEVAKWQSKQLSASQLGVTSRCGIAGAIFIVETTHGGPIGVSVSFANPSSNIFPSVLPHAARAKDLGVKVLM